MLPPLRFRPLIKNLRWGGTQLGTLLGKPIGTAQNAAESWEVVDHGSNQSIVAVGPFAGWTLADLMREYRSDLLGPASTQTTLTPTTTQTTFPLLVKFLDAHDRISLQVHPDSSHAREMTGLDCGKTEAWVILQAQAGSLIYAGLRAGVQKSHLEYAVRNGTLTECVHTFEARRGDCILIPAGTIHAIGEGVLLAEIQQTSDTTFRLHDWGRVGMDGLPRQLHIREALECTDYSRGPINPLTPRTIATGGKNRTQELVACDYFVIHRHQGTAAWSVNSQHRFRIVMLLQGDAELTWPDNSDVMTTGDTILIPASCPNCQIIPKAECTLLEVFVPDGRASH